jgi:transposase InsO family protein
VKCFGKPDKYAEIKNLISQIYHAHKGRYGYRRITLELRNQGYCINHKTVQRLMGQLKLKSLVRIKKYRSYRGHAGEILPDILQRDFKADKPCQKWVTDISEFSLLGQKIYLSTILDLYNGEIISYTYNHRPNYALVDEMLQTALSKLPEQTDLILHSDQGWHYQMKTYRHSLKQRGIRQSMSRKGNCLDNAVMENFFGILKSEFFYLMKFHTIEEFLHELEEYITYYNTVRIKAKLGGLSPVKYRIQSSLVA